MSMWQNSKKTRKVPVIAAATIGLTAALGLIASPASALGIAHSGAYHGNSWYDSNGWLNALTHHDNVYGTNYTCVQGTSNGAPISSKPRVCANGMTTWQVTTSYYAAGGRHWKSSATSVPEAWHGSGRSIPKVGTACPLSTRKWGTKCQE